MSEASTSARLTCLCAADPADVLQQQQAAAAAHRKLTSTTASKQKQSETQQHGGKPHKSSQGLPRKSAGVVKAKQKAPPLGQPLKAEQEATQGVVHDGVVDFMTSPKVEKEKARKKLKKRQRSSQAAEQEAAPRPRASQPGGGVVAGQGFRIITKQRRK